MQIQLARDVGQWIFGPYLPLKFVCQQAHLEPDSPAHQSMVDVQRLAVVQICSMSTPDFLATAIAPVQSTATRARCT